MVLESYVLSLQVFHWYCEFMYRGVIESFAKEYPQSLTMIKDPPKTIFWKGNISLLYSNKMVSVVGTRRISIYGKKVTQKMVRELVSVNVVIVSGFMTGVDAAAHGACLDAGGFTIAVMPCGIDYIHPEDQTELYERILNNQGLIISEYSESFKPQIWTYVRRNRILAGLSSGVLVTEAALNSGSLITVELARKANKSIFAVPGSIFNEYSKGTLHIIKEGACIVSSGFDIAENLGFSLSSFRDNPIDSPNFYDPESLEYKIYSMLQSDAMTVDELSRILSIPMDIINSKVTLMTLDGLLMEDAGKLFV